MIRSLADFTRLAREKAFRPAKQPAPDERAIRVGLSGNLCRCTGYQAVVRAVAAAAREATGRW